MSTKKELLWRIRTALGGRAAEIVYYGKEEGLSTGAGGDLNQARAIAEAIVCNYGMDESIGLYVGAKESVTPDRVVSINKILNEEMLKAIDLISTNKDRIDRLVVLLLKKNKLTGPEIVKCFEET